MTHPEELKEANAYGNNEVMVVVCNLSCLHKVFQRLKTTTAILGFLGVLKFELHELICFFYANETKFF